MSTKESEIEDVLIQVRGGMAEVLHAPENVNVVIHDLDNCGADDALRLNCPYCTPAEGEAT